MAQAALTICHRCNKISRGDCCRAESERDNYEQRKLYRTARWRRVRKRVLMRDKGLCQACLAKGKLERGNHVDHKLRAIDRPDLFWNADNLQTLCHRCHSRKTRHEMTEPGGGE